MGVFNLYHVPYTLNNLNPNTAITSIADLKNKIQILVIDDRDFSFLDSLINREFRIRQRKDIDDINDVVSFDIILCDIRGVGKFLNSQYEGANLIKEIKTQHPNKYVIAYTANDYDARFENYLNYADKVFAKGMLGPEDWASMLEEALKSQASPANLWKKTRKALLDAGVPTITVAKYESAYVQSLNNGDYESFDKLCNTRENNGTEILKDMTTSVIAKLLKP